VARKIAERSKTKEKTWQLVYCFGEGKKCVGFDRKESRQVSFREDEEGHSM